MKFQTKATAMASRATLALACLAFGVGCEAEPEVEVAEQPPASDAVEVETRPDGSWVSVTGRVIDAGPDSFSLDYGGGAILVEFDDQDWFPEGKYLLENDDVIVYGYIDDDFYEQRTIEASSVYVKDLGTQFYASGVDEEDFPAVGYADFRPHIQVRGEVQSVAGEEFILDTGARTIEVDTEDMRYNPLDAEGFQQIKPGDRVFVSGRLDPDLFDKNDLVAESIVSLQGKS